MSSALSSQQPQQQPQRGGGVRVLADRKNTMIDHNHNGKKKKEQQTKTVHMWVCDVCKVQSFADFHEACRHEDVCRQKSLGQNNQKQDDPPPKPKENEQKKQKQNEEEKDHSSKLLKPAPAPAPHAFFQVKTKSSKQTASSSSYAAVKVNEEKEEKEAAKPNQKPPLQNNKKKQKPVHSFFDLTATTAKQKKANKKPPPSTISSKKRSQAAPPVVFNVDTNETEAFQSLKGSTSTASSKNKKLKVAVAPIFSTSTVDSKQLLAEQRQVEFQAKRRLQRQQELERQQRRQQEQQAQQNEASKDPFFLGNKKSSSSSQQPVQVQRRRPSPPLKRKNKGILAPRFPKPSHVIPDSSSLETETEETKESMTNHVEKKFSRASIAKARHQRQQVTQMPIQSEALKEHGQSNHRLVDLKTPSAAETAVTPSDLLQVALQQVLTVRQPSFNSRSNNNTSKLWTEQYGMLKTGIVASSTRATAHHLITNWMDEWKQARAHAMDRMSERQQQLLHNKKKKKVQYKDDDDLWSDDEDCSLDNVCVLSGPPGCGKTSLVYHIAKEAKCPVVELNTTAARGATALKHKIQEATQSCSSMELLKHQQKQQLSLFAPKSSSSKATGRKKSQCVADSDDEEDGSNDPSNRSSVTIILIDEVDILYESHGDGGFWTALSSVAKTSKCPIVLTCNGDNLPAQLSNIRHKQVHLSRPSPSECAVKLLEICEQEETLEFRSKLGQQQVLKQLEWVAQLCDCDLRKQIMELQSFSTSGGAGTVPTPYNIEETKALDSPTTDTDFRLPKILSVSPEEVPHDAYSVITIQGEHFDSFLQHMSPCPSSQDEEQGSCVEVMVGGQPCPRARICDAQTILALCPPCRVPSHVDPTTGRLRKLCYDDTDNMANHRFSLDTLFPEIIVQAKQRSHMRGIISVSDPLTTETLANDTVTTWRTRPCIEYDFRNDNDDEEHEMELDPPTESMEQNDEVANHPGLSKAIEQFESEVAGCSIDIPRESKSADLRVPSDDDNVFDNISREAHLLSDAAFLEDMQTGVPRLGGASMGFGYNLTEDGENGKAEKYDSMKPPREEKLFELGWKENAGFFGSSDEFMVGTFSTREKLIFRRTMNELRGLCFADAEEVVDKDEDETSDDVDDITRVKPQVSEEDMFLSRTFEDPLCALPNILRQEAACFLPGSLDVLDLERRKHVAATEMYELLEYIIDDDSRVKLSRPKLGVPPVHSLCPGDYYDEVAFLDYLPVLRSIALSESVAEFIHEASKSDNEKELARSSRRSTRSKTRNGRQHYFDKVSRSLQLDLAGIPTGDVAKRLEAFHLQYGTRNR